MVVEFVVWGLEGVVVGGGEFDEVEGGVVCGDWFKGNVGVLLVCGLFFGGEFVGDGVVGVEFFVLDGGDGVDFWVVVVEFMFRVE